MLKKKKKIMPVTEPKVTEPAKPDSYHSGDTYGWYVEARVATINEFEPATYLCGYSGKQKLLTQEWQRITFFKGTNPAGVPTALFGARESALEEFSLLSKLSAKALAYTFAAQNAHTLSSIETRIVKCKVRYKFEKWVTDDVLPLTNGTSAWEQ